MYRKIFFYLHKISNLRYLLLNKPKKIYFMGCGCKNKSSQTNQTNQPQPQTQVNTQPTQNSVQEAIKRTIEKYYVNKKPTK